jgi:hypothetical protein
MPFVNMRLAILLLLTAMAFIGGSYPRSAQAQEGFAPSLFVGIWTAGITNNDGIALSVETVFTKDGQFDSMGVVGPRTRAQRYQGVWRIDGDYLCITSTNATPPKPDAFRENRSRILSVSQDHFSYERKQRIWTWTRKK